MLLKAKLVVGFSWAMTFGIGEAATAITQLAPKIAFQAVAHGMTQGVVSGIQGGNFWQGAASGALASIGASAWGGLGGNFARSGAGQITFGTISGGAGAALTGGNFWEGAATGFVVSAANHLLHKKQTDPKKKKQNPRKKRLNWLGRKIQSYAGSDFSKEMFANFWNGGGDVILTTEEFTDIVKHAKPLGKGERVTFNGQEVIKRSVRLYGTEYGRAIGDATIYYNMAGSPVGFYDYYDFNPYPVRWHSFFNAQLKTELVDTASWFNAKDKPFSIRYPN